MRSAERAKFPFRLQPGTFGSESDRRIATVMQWIVASGFLLGAGTLIVVAIVQLVDRMTRA
jgi:hypothetical protein